MLSGAALLSVCCINLVRSVFESTQSTPPLPTEVVMRAMDHAENALLLWIPLAGLGIIFIVIFFRVGIALIKWISRRQQGKRVCRLCVILSQFNLFHGHMRSLLTAPSGPGVGRGFSSRLGHTKDFQNGT